MHAPRVPNDERSQSEKEQKSDKHKYWEEKISRWRFLKGERPAFCQHGHSDGNAFH